MKNEATSIAEPLSFVETAVLSAFATKGRLPPETDEATQAYVDLVEAKQSLTRRGMLTKEGIVSPEGLAALLDTVPVESLTSPR